MSAACRADMLRALLGSAIDFGPATSRESVCIRAEHTTFDLVFVRRCPGTVKPCRVRKRWLPCGEKHAGRS